MELGVGLRRGRDRSRRVVSQAQRGPRPVQQDSPARCAQFGQLDQRLVARGQRRAHRQRRVEQHQQRHRLRPPPPVAAPSPRRSGRRPRSRPAGRGHAAAPGAFRRCSRAAASAKVGMRRLHRRTGRAPAGRRTAGQRPADAPGGAGSARCRTCPRPGRTACCAPPSPSCIGTRWVKRRAGAARRGLRRRRSCGPIAGPSISAAQRGDGRRLEQHRDREVDAVGLLDHREQAHRDQANGRRGRRSCPRRPPAPRPAAPARSRPACVRCRCAARHSRCRDRGGRSSGPRRRAASAAAAWRDQRGQVERGDDDLRQAGGQRAAEGLGPFVGADALRRGCAAGALRRARAAWRRPRVVELQLARVGGGRKASAPSSRRMVKPSISTQTVAVGRRPA